MIDGDGEFGIIWISGVDVAGSNLYIISSSESAADRDERIPPLGPTGRSKIRQYLQELLTDHGFIAHTAATGLEGKKILEKITPDLILLDLKLPDVTGESLCKQFKTDYPHIIIIMLTAKDTPEDLAKGLNIGADDYIAKPFTSQELIARVRARTRDFSKQDKPLQIADLVLDSQTHRITRAEQDIELSPQEFKLLHYLMTNPNQVLSRDMILSRIWGTAVDVETRVVDVYVGYLRKKIDQDFSPKLITSVRGFGYMLKDPNPSPKSSAQVAS